MPAFNTLPLTVQRAAVAAIAVRAGKVIPPVAGLVIVLGILRGTVFGQIQSLTALTSAYGLTWLAASSSPAAPSSSGSASSNRASTESRR